MADTGLSKPAEIDAEVAKPVEVEFGLLSGMAGELRDDRFGPLFARAVSIGGGRFVGSLSDLLFSLSCSMDTARMWSM